MTGYPPRSIAFPIFFLILGPLIPVLLTAHPQGPQRVPVPVPPPVKRPQANKDRSAFPPVPVFGPGPINEPSEITDFNGLVGICRVTGAGTGTDLATGTQTRLSYQVDNGFMSGLYVGEDGRKHHGTFAFI